MSDYTLSANSNITISEDTYIDDFYDCGGRISVPPDVTFVMSGTYRFAPTDSLDPAGYIYRTFLNRAAIEGGSNGLLRGYMLYDMYPESGAIFFPCLIIDYDETEEVAEDFFGGEHMYPLFVSCDLVFKKDHVMLDSGVDEDGVSITLSERSLAENRLVTMTDLFKSIEFVSDDVKVGTMNIEATVKEPNTPKQSLYGFKMDINLDYKIIE